MIDITSDGNVSSFIGQCSDFEISDKYKRKKKEMTTPMLSITMNSKLNYNHDFLFALFRS